MSETNRSISSGIAPAPPPAKGGQKNRLWWFVAALAAVVVVIGVIWIPGAVGSGASVIASLPRAKVDRGPMTVSITEDGEIEAEQQQVIRNELDWAGVIVELFPEGKVIQKGQTAVRFECDKLIDTITEQTMRVQQAKDDHSAAVTNYDIKKMDLDARVVQAGYAVEDAEANLAKYTEAEWNQLQAEAKGAIDQAKGDLDLAESKYQAKLTINEDPELKQPYSKSEIEADKLTVEKLQRALARAKMDKDILHKYTHPRRLRNLQTAVEDAKREQLSALAERDKQLALAKTQKETKEYALKDAEEKLTDSKADRDEYLDIKADQTGLVVYETRVRHWARPITVALNEEVSPRQQLMIIPDSKTLVVKSRVYESIREQVSVGLPARIRLDARAGQSLMGSVSKVAFLPDNQNPWLSPGVKVYPTTITFNDDVTGLDVKPGMTCDVEITLAELPDALSVPIAAVFSDQDVTFCYRVAEDGTAQRVEVELGLTSETRAQIKSGLTEGDAVLLVPPPGEQIHRKPPADEKDTPASMPAMNGGAPNEGGRPAVRDPGRPEGSATSRPTTQGAGGDGQERARRPRRSSGGDGGRGPR